MTANTSRRSRSLPKVNSDIGAGSAVSQRASAAAIFIGWTRTMYCAWEWPTTMTARVAARPYTAPMRNDRRKASRVSSSFARARCQALMPRTKKAPVAMAPVTT